MARFSANGHQTSGYHAVPSGGRGPGLLVIQEWWGLVDHIKDVADRFAGAGFATLAPDFYAGKTTSSPDDAAKLCMALNIDRAAADLRGAADFLLGHPATTSTRVGTLGFCMGGQLALYAAVEYPDRIGAGVDFYGIHPNVKVAAAKLRVPILAHFAKRDVHVSEVAANGLLGELRSAGGSVEAHFYDADHGFFNDTRAQAYDAGCARLAWDRSVAFLHRHVG